MTQSFACRWYVSWLASAALFVSLDAAPARAHYEPIALPSGNEIADILSDKDIPTGEGGFFRDYQVKLENGDQVAIDLISDEFDSIVTLIKADGSTVAENDDGPDGSTNSLLFARITEAGDYIVRVRAFGETGGGNFKIKLTRLRPI
jgi:Bacterial pre-peptidase C-terminal domain